MAAEPKTSFVALTYHKIEDAPSNIYAVRPAAFREQLTWLRAEGYVIENFTQLERRVASGEIPPRYAVVSFDDGHASQLVAADALAAAGAQASFFLTKNLSTHESAYLGRTQIADVAAAFSVGSHGVTHQMFSRLSRPALRAELADSRMWLEDITGAPVTTCSAPGGYINPRVAREAINCGYTLIGNSFEWWNVPELIAEQHVVNRVAVRASFNLDDFRRIVCCAPGTFLKRRLRTYALEVPKTLLTPRMIMRLRHMIYGRQTFP